MPARRHGPVGPTHGLARKTAICQRVTARSRTVEAAAAASGDVVVEQGLHEAVSAVGRRYVGEALADVERPGLRDPVAQRLEEGGVPVGRRAGSRVRDGEAIGGPAGREAVGGGSGGDGPVSGSGVEEGIRRAGRSGEGGRRAGEGERGGADVLPGGVDEDRLAGLEDAVDVRVRAAGGVDILDEAGGLCADDHATGWTGAALVGADVSHSLGNAVLRRLVRHILPLKQV